MIINTDLEFCFVSTPKTGTHTMYHFLPNVFGGFRYGAYHERNLPEYAKDYTVFTTVRHPLQRLVSAYTSLLKTSDYRPIFEQKIGDTSFQAFCEWVCSLDNTKVHQGQGMPVINTQSAWLSCFDDITMLRIECIDIDFWHKLDFVNNQKKVVFPQILSRPHSDWGAMMNELDSRLLTRIYDWFEPDFQMLSHLYKF